jgi:flagellar hook-associated protein 3 FlgL
MMAIDRVATNSQTSYMLSQIGKANVKLQQAQNQVTTQKVATDYAGFGDKTAALEGARAAADRAKAYADNTQIAVNQADLQDTQLTTLTGLAQQLQKAIQNAAANADGTGLMTTAQSIFEQASSLLNATDSNGNYIYGGEVTDKPPFTATSMANLTTQPSVSNFFQNGTIKKSVVVGDNLSEPIGVLASDIGVKLMDALKALYQEDQLSGTPGDLKGQLTETQVGSLASTLAPKAIDAYKSLSAATAVNGDTYNTLKSEMTNQQSLQNLYKGFVGDIEDVDMATALTNLSNNQTAMQAVLTVTSKLNELTLLNYLPISG